MSLILTPINNFVVTNILNKPIYNDDALKAINIVRSEERVFYNENWNRNFKYVQFCRNIMKLKTHKQKYVNVSKFNGREVKNNSNCDINFYFYGSSLTFGYNVKDTQTIPSYFKKTLESLYPMSNYCVFNFGSASYFSTQENILFQHTSLIIKLKQVILFFLSMGILKKVIKKVEFKDILRKYFNGV